MKRLPVPHLGWGLVVFLVAAMLPAFLWVWTCAALDLEATKLANPPAEIAGVHPAPWNADRALGLHEGRGPRPDPEVFTPQDDEPAAANPIKVAGRWPYGPCKALAVDNAGQYVFMGSGAGIYVLDWLSPPWKLGELAMPGLVQGLFFVPGKNLLYVATLGAGLRVVDVSKWWDLKEIGSAPTPARAEAVYVSGAYAYVAASTDGLAIFDVSTPAVPVRVRTVPTHSTALDVKVAGSGAFGFYAFVADGFAGLTIIDVGSPQLATEACVVPTSGYDMGVEIVGDYAFVASAAYGLRIVNVKDVYGWINPPPYQVSFCDTPGHAQKIAIPVSMVYAYVADGDGGLQVIDISTIGNPKVVSSWVGGGFASAVAISANGVISPNGALYLATETNDLQLFDLVTPSAPSYISAFHNPSYAQDVFAANGYAYVADGESGLWVLDVRNPQAPYAVGHCDTPRPALAVQVVGSYAYVADGWMSLRIIDVSNPFNPQEVGSRLTPDVSYDVCVVYPYAYVADGASGLQIIDIGDPTNPKWVGSLGWAGCQARGVAVAGTTAYVADAAHGLRVVDIQDRAAPKDITTVWMSNPAIPRAVAVRGDYAYVAVGGNGLLIFDIHNPASPTQTGWCYFVWPTYSIALAGSRAYLGSEVGLYIADISDPHNPIHAGSLEQAGGVGGVFYAAPYLYAANWDLGVSILAHYGSLSVKLKPKAISSGKGRWRVAGKSWKKSGGTAGYLLPGKRKIQFKPVSGWVTPKPRTVVISPGQTKKLNIRYGD